MYAHVQATASGWWGGVLHPMESVEHVLTMLLVGLLGGLSVRAARASWTLPVLFIAGLSVGGAVGRLLERSVDLEPVLIGVAMLMAVLLFVHPRRTRVIAPVAVLATAVLHGLEHGASATGVPRSAAFVVGFVFTSVLLLSVGAIVGASIGRVQRGRRVRGVGAPPTAAPQWHRPDAASTLRR